MSTGTPIEEALSNFIVEASPPDLALHASLFGFVDFAACAAAGAGLLGGIVDVGRVARSVFGANGDWRSEGPAAVAFRIGCLGHAGDFDDTFDRAGMHPSLVAVPGAVAVALTTGASGRDLLDALVIGREVATRLGASVADGRAGEPRWMQNTVFGPLATAAACARLLGLDHATSVHALGVAVQLAGGTQAMGYSTGGNVRAFYGGWSAAAGVLATFMAREGVTANSEAIGGATGHLAAFYGSWREDILLDDLGSRYLSEDVSIKPWPTCRVAHPFLTMVEDLGSVDVDDIERVVLHTNAIGMKLSTPIDQRRHPSNFMDAKFSLPFVVATMLVKGEVGLTSFDDAGLVDPAVAAVADRVSAVMDTSVQGASQFVASARMEIKVGGSTIQRETSCSKGDAGRPLTETELNAKVESCVDFAQRAVAVEVVDVLGLWRLEAASNASEVLRPWVDAIARDVRPVEVGT